MTNDTPTDAEPPPLDTPQQTGRGQVYHAPAGELARPVPQGGGLPQGVLDSMADGILLLDQAGHVVMVNQPLADLWGVRREGLGRGVFDECLPAGEPRLPYGLVWASLADGQPRAGQTRYAAADGSQHILRLRAQPLDENGARGGHLLVQVSDITAQARLEGLMLELDRLMASQRLAATVAHEVHTPLQSIESCLHLAGRLADEEQRLRYLRLAREEIQRIGRLMHQLLDLHRPSPSPTAPVDLNALVEQVLLLAGPSLSRQQIRVVQELAPGLPPIVGRRDELTQVLLNLVFNAIQAMPGGGRLLLRTRGLRQGDDRTGVQLTVSDNGPGIEPAILGRIFEPFFTTRVEGNGLGLAISQRIIQSHGGTIGVESAPGEGTSFHLRFPAAETV